MRVLIVEDESSIRSALARGLSQHGHRVQTAATLAEARERAAAQPPEALVSDLKLPDGSGLDVAEELRLPFVLMTGFGTFDDAVRALRLGCIDFFTKPVAIRDICRALDLLTGRQSQGPTVLARAAASTERLAMPSRSGRHAAVPPPVSEAPGWQEPTPLGSRIAGGDDDQGVDLHPGVDDLLLIQSRGSRFAAHRVTVQTVTWRSPAAAQQAFAALQPLLASMAQRQVAAELLQSAPHGRLVVNVADDSWSAWLDAFVDWSQLSDRCQIIDDICRRCLWSASGALVECAHAG